MNRFINLFYKTCITTVFPMILGTLFFSGVIETYKNDMTSRKEILDDYYRPMIASQANCQDIHSKLINKYYYISGASQSFSDEIVKVSQMDWSKITYPQAILSKSIIENFTESVSQLEVLKVNQSKCFSELRQRYNEMSIVFGVYNDYIKIVINENKKINKLYQERSVLMPGKEGLMDRYAKLSREFFDFYEDESRMKRVLHDMNDVAMPLSKYYYDLGGNEKMIFDTEIELFNKVNEVFARELNERYKRGYISKWFL